MKRVIQPIILLVIAFSTIACTGHLTPQLLHLSGQSLPSSASSLLQPTVTIIDSDEAEYLRWFNDVETRILELLDRNAAWTDDAISAYPKIPETLLTDGERLRGDWSTLADEVGAREPPHRYKSFHSEFSTAVRLAAEATAFLYNAVSTGDMIKAGEAVAVQSRAQAALDRAFELVLEGEDAVIPSTSPPSAQISPESTPEPAVSRPEPTPSPATSPTLAPAQAIAGRADREPPTAMTPLPLKINIPTGLTTFVHRSYCIGNSCFSFGAMALATLTAALVLAISARALDKRDTEPPNLVSFEFEPRLVNTSMSDQAITFTARITDKLVGVGNPTSEGSVYGSFAQFRSPSGNQQAHVSFTYRERVSGHERDGIYVSTMTLPRHSEPGIWRFSYMEIQDNAGNGRTISLDEMTRSGFPVELRVESSMHQANSENTR